MGLRIRYLFFPVGLSQSAQSEAWYASLMFGAGAWSSAYEVGFKTYKNYPLVMTNIAMGNGPFIEMFTY